ncbi:MAG: ABC transporter ATP-binding protein [Nitrososphaerales archaeon]|nr:ABC transporter ATP-binding protein [Nitrososphaerales archaeon]
MIQTINLTKIYSDKVTKVYALQDVNIEVSRGEFVAVCGPSGSGKSTLLNLLGTLDRPTSGKVLIDGIDVYRLSDNKLAELRNRKIGFVFQSYNLINRTTVLKNVLLPAIIKGDVSKDRIERALNLLEKLGLKDKAHRKPLALSGGEQQRVAIARALINNPSVILADEPTGNLDSKTGHEIFQYLKYLAKEQNTTVVVVTHNLELAAETDRVINLRDGRVERIWYPR